MWLDRFRGPRVTTDADGTLMVQQGRRAIRVAARHAVYADDVRMYFDYYHRAVESTDVDGWAVVDYTRPAWHTFRPSGRRFYFTALAEPERTTDAYLAFAGLQPGDLVLDLGAYCGGATVAFARTVGPTGHVVAVEPDPANAAALRVNLAHHAVPSVTVIEAGVWSETGTVAFAAEGNMGSAVAAVLARPSPTVGVPVLSLDDLVREAVRLSGLPRVAFLKVDIEGAEVPMLETAEDVIRQHRPRLAVEPHFTPAGPINTEAVEMLLTGFGYTCERVYHGVGFHPMITATPSAQ